MNDSRIARTRTGKRLSLPGRMGSQVSSNTGALATAGWLIARGLDTTQAKWFVEVSLESEQAELRLELFAEEWGFVFRRGEEMSWIRVTDLRFVHGRDDFGLLAETPPLRDIGVLVRRLEDRFDHRFDRAAARVNSTLQGSEPAIRQWLATL